LVLLPYLIEQNTRKRKDKQSKRTPAQRGVEIKSCITVDFRPYASDEIDGPTTYTVDCAILQRDKHFVSALYDPPPLARFNNSAFVVCDDLDKDIRRGPSGLGNYHTRVVLLKQDASSNI
jgi:hypothetical protein